MKNLLAMTNISKTFPGVKALDSVDFFLNKGEIHALMGENGAGKSTLIKVLTGVETFESGEIRLEGIAEPLINRSPEQAQENGISTVYQEVNLCPNLSVAENIYIGREPKKMGIINWKKMNVQAKKLMDDLDIIIDVKKPLEEYSVAIQQMVAIARAVDISAKVLILDEPTSSLDDQEVQKLFALMRRLRGEGLGIVFVTHFLEQVYEVCDKITVLRNGALVGEYSTKSLPRVQLVAAMMGKEFDDLAEIRSQCSESAQFSGQPYICAKNIGLTGVMKPFDLDIHKGEIVGLTGLLGSGRTEIASLLYGSLKADCGKLKIEGEGTELDTPLDAMKVGMAMLPEDRKAEGIIEDLSARDNLLIALQAKRGPLRPISRKEQDELADKYIDLLQIKTASKETPIKQLSGGNQQKVILGRWLITNPEFLILDEPTRGIDVGTKTEIQKLMLELADDGTSIMFISSEIDEMLRTADRLGVLRDRQKVGELDKTQFSQKAVMKAIAGGEIDGGTEK